MKHTPYGTIHLGGGAMEYVDGPPPPQASVSVLPDLNDTLRNFVPLGWSWRGVIHWEEYDPNSPCNGGNHDYTEWVTKVEADPEVEFNPIPYRTRACQRTECEAHEIELLERPND